MIRRWRSKNRWYKLAIQQDLFGKYCVFRFWHGLYNKRGNDKYSTFDTHEEALKEVNRIAKQKERKGYRPELF